MSRERGSNFEGPQWRRRRAVAGIVHAYNVHNRAEAGVVAECGQEVIGQVAHCVRAHDGGGLGTNGIKSSTQLLDVGSAAPGPLVPYADVVYADVVMRARSSDECRLVLNVIVGEVGAVADPARNTLRNGMHEGGGVHIRSSSAPEPRTHDNT